MMFKTMLRKWHTFVGIVIVLPLTVLILTGILLLYPQSGASSLVAFTACDSGEVITATSQELLVNNARIPVRFPVDAISSMACHNQTLDVAIEYGPIFSTKLTAIAWSIIPAPSKDRIASIHRTEQALFAANVTSVWQYTQHDDWQQLHEYPPSMTQLIGMIHSGWWMNWSFRWVWLVVGIGWFMLALSGCWIYLRMIRRTRTD